MMMVPGTAMLLTACLSGAPGTPAAFPAGDAAELGLDAPALAALLEEAKTNGTDVLVVVKNGKQVLEWHAPGGDGPIETMSVTKSVVALGLGRLMEQGKLRSMEEPLHTFFPEWNQGRKKDINLRHLLAHTSGLQSDRTTHPEIQQAPDRVKLALAAELTTTPGTAFFYNNKAANLLPAIIQKLSGKRADKFLTEEVFKPLGIKDIRWELDQAGNPQGMAGLSMRGVDLARVGVLVADGGLWGGKQLIHKTWMAESMQPGQGFNPHCGLMWWLNPEWRRVTLTDDAFGAWKAAGMDPDILGRMQPFRGQTFAKGELKTAVEKRYGDDAVLTRWNRVLDQKGLTPGQVTVGPTQAVMARGWLGQSLVVVPKDKLVAVRLHKMREGDEDDDARTTDWLQFEDRVMALLPKKDPPEQ